MNALNLKAMREIIDVDDVPDSYMKSVSSGSTDKPISKISNANGGEVNLNDNDNMGSIQKEIPSVTQDINVPDENNIHNNILPPDAEQNNLYEEFVVENDVGLGIWKDVDEQLWQEPTKSDEEENGEGETLDKEFQEFDNGLLTHQVTN